MRMASVAVPVATLWTSPEAPRDIDAAAVASPPDVAGWTAALDTEARLGLHGRVVTQLLLGEPVEVTDERRDWLHVVAPWQPSSLDARGYPGWLPRAHVVQTSAYADAGSAREPVAVVTSTSALLDVDDTRWQLSYATTLPLADEPGARAAVRVLLPDGRRGRLDPADVSVRPDRGSVEYAAEDVLAAARRFLGLGYLWGGTCGLGLDCSGLVHLVHRALGRVVPRDAHDQQEAAEPVELERVRPGDLYFFARPGQTVHHVGFVTAPASQGPRMLHAPESGRTIEEAPLAPQRTQTLVAAGRFAAVPSADAVRP